MKIWSFADIQGFILSNAVRLECAHCGTAVEIRPDLVFSSRYNDLTGQFEVIVGLGISADNMNLEPCDSLRGQIFRTKEKYRAALRATLVGTGAEDALMPAPDVGGTLN